MTCLNTGSKLGHLETSNAPTLLFDQQGWPSFIQAFAPGAPAS